MKTNIAKHASLVAGTHSRTQMHKCVRGLSALPRQKIISRPLPAPIATYAAAGSVEDEVSDNDTYVDDFDRVRLRDRGYTPFEFLEFTNIPLKHEVSVWVDRPVAECFSVWKNRLNWMQWFNMIDEVGFHEEEPSYMSMYMWYRWATTPFLELYVTLERTQEEENKYILEEPVEGLPLVAAVLFVEGEDAETEQPRGTTVTLRLSYLLPKVLHEFAGQVAVYGDVDTKLQGCMERMKQFVEGVDIAALEEARVENENEIQANFAQQREQKHEAVRQRELKTAEWHAAAEAAEGKQEGGAAGQQEGGEVSTDDEDTGKGRVRRRRVKAGSDMANPAAKRKPRKSTKAVDG